MNTRALARIIPNALIKCHGEPLCSKSDKRVMSNDIELIITIIGLSIIIVTITTMMMINIDADYTGYVTIIILA